MLVCLGAYAVVFSNSATYNAQSRIVASTHVQDVGGLAAAHARAYSDEDEGVEVKSAVDANTKTVTITVTSANEEASIELANSIAQNVLDESLRFVPDNAEDPFNARVELADEAVDAESMSILKCLLIAIALGLFVVACYVLIFNWTKRPIISIESVMGITGLPVLETLPVADGGERLLANIRFASKNDDVQSISLIPVGENADAVKAAEALEEAAQKDSVDKLDILCRDSLSKSMVAAYESRKDDATVLVATQWNDSLPALEAASAELKLAGANLIGTIFAKPQ